MISRDDVLYVAALARLELSDGEAVALSGELGAILEAVSKVSELDLDDVEPLTHPLQLDLELDGLALPETDQPLPSLALRDALLNAPAVDGPYFVVPSTKALEPELKPKGRRSER